MRIPRISELRPFLKWFGSNMVIFFVTVFFALLVQPEIALKALGIILSFWLISNAFKKENRLWVRAFSLLLGGYLLLGVFVKTITITFGVGYALLAVYPYQLGGSPSAIITFSSLFVFIFGAALLMGTIREGEEVWESAGSIGALGAILLLLVAMFSDPSTFVSLARGIPFLAPILSGLGILGEIGAMLLGLTMSTFLSFVAAFLGATIGEYIL